jgi:hypothetical protein
MAGCRLGVSGHAYFVIFFVCHFFAAFFAFTTCFFPSRFKIPCGPSVEVEVVCPAAFFFLAMSPSNQPLVSNVARAFRFARAGVGAADLANWRLSVERCPERSPGRRKPRTMGGLFRLVFEIIAPRARFELAANRLTATRPSALGEALLRNRAAAVFLGEGGAENSLCESMGPFSPSQLCKVLVFQGLWLNPRAHHPRIDLGTAPK